MWLFEFLPPSSNNAAITPTPTPSQTSSTTQTAGSTCNFPILADGETVYYGGATGQEQGIFTNVSESYLGTVQTIFADGEVTVNWTSLNESSTLAYNLIFPKGTCNPDITGSQVIYTGQQGPTIPNFSTAGVSYTGTVVAVFATGFIEVNWGAPLSAMTVEPLSNLSLGQQPRHQVSADRLGPAPSSFRRQTRPRAIKFPQTD